MKYKFKIIKQGNKTVKIKLVDVPYGKDVKWSKYFDFYRSKGDKSDNMQAAYRTRICPYGRKKGFGYNSADTALVAIVNKATQRRLNKIKL